MDEISEDYARSLIISGAAGYWACHHKTIPVPHAEQTVIRLNNKLYLLPADKFKVSLNRVIELNDRLKGEFSITCSDEFNSIVMEEINRKRG